MTNHEEEAVITVEIFYGRSGIDYHDFSVESPERIESRNLAWLLTCMLHDLMDEMQDMDEHPPECGCEGCYPGPEEPEKEAKDVVLLPM